MNQIRDIQIERKFDTHFLKLSINYQSLGHFEHNPIKCTFVISNADKIISTLYLSECIIINNLNQLMLEAYYFGKLN